MKTLPLDFGNPRYDFSTQLGDHKFRFGFVSYVHTGNVLMSVECTTATLRIDGHRLSVGYDIFLPYASRFGALIVFGPDDANVSLGTLGDVHRILWFSKAEIDAIRT